MPEGARPERRAVRRGGNGRPRRVPDSPLHRLRRAGRLWIAGDAKGATVLYASLLSDPSFRAPARAALREIARQFDRLAAEDARFAAARTDLRRDLARLLPEWVITSGSTFR